MVSSLIGDPDMAKLNAAADQQVVPTGGRLLMGMANVTDEGRLQLGAPGVDRETLRSLASWVQHNASAHPALARLKGARMLSIRADGVVLDRFEDDGLWDGLASPPAPGSLAAESAALDGLSVGQNAWFWMSTAGPQLLVTPVATDPRGQAFRLRLRPIRSAAGDAPALAGIVRPVTDGLVLTTSDDIRHGPEIARALLAAWPVERLRGARLVQMADGRFVGGLTLDVAAPEGPVMTRQQDVLGALVEGAQALFWLTDAGRDGRPMLLLDTDKNALRAAAKDVGGGGRTTRGVLVARKNGRFEFQIRKPYADFLSVLVSWVGTHQTQNPALKALHHSRMSVRDSDGEILERHKDDDAWNALT
ncbi:MAG: hypothetical protein AAFV53_11490 [Myxococcota bacterium]